MCCPGGEPFPLPRARGASLRARLGQNYRIVRAEGQRGPWKAKVTACHYTLEESDGLENDPDPMASGIDQRAA